MASGWFATLTAVQLKDLLAAASIPVSGPKAIKMERLLQSAHTNVYDVHDVSDNDRYNTVLRLL
jgi:hypothetical protein